MEAIMVMEYGGSTYSICFRDKGDEGIKLLLCLCKNSSAYAFSIMTSQTTCPSCRSVLTHTQCSVFIKNEWIQVYLGLRSMQVT
ncbi:hypothetical protein TREES_T100000390 [Tupaia chinensis]|uniref:Uncharacterized protein n=1 Tax=Tupaia chinensis TaxID=246437 RepID=L9KWD8_TUPCH|nr:hypothetical protein TREES_T100000390 [Tupaia chinensis]